MSHGDLCELETVVEGEFDLDALFVGADRFFADPHGLGDLRGGLPLADQGQYHEFAVAETVEVAGIFNAPPGKIGQQLVGHRGAEGEPTSMHLSHGFDQVLGRRFLHQITGGSGAEGALGIDRLGKLREDEHFRLGKGLRPIGDAAQGIRVAEEQR